MNFSVAGQRISLVSFSYQFGLVTDEGSALQIEAPFRLNGEGDYVEPGRFDSERVAGLTGLLFDVYKSVSLHGSELVVSFLSGARIEIPAIMGFESWTLNLPGMSPSLVVMGPEGVLDFID